MKYKKTLGDGTVIEVEGTAEEIAQWERDQSQVEAKKESKERSKRRILTEERIRQIAREEAIATKQSMQIISYPIPCSRPHADEWWRIVSFVPDFVPLTVGDTNVVPLTVGETAAPLTIGETFSNRDLHWGAGRDYLPNLVVS